MSEYIFKLPDLGEGTVESEIAEWFIAIGDQVNEEDVVGTMMTDKAAVELSSPVSGRVVSLAGEPGDMVAVGAPLVVFDTSADDNAGDAATATEKPVKEPEKKHGKAATKGKLKDNKPPAESDANSRVMTSPAIRRRAKESGVDLTQITGSGPGGRIVRKDLEGHVHETEPATAPGRRRKSRPKEIKIIGLRRLIAERMSTATREIPHFTYVEECDITELEKLRQYLNARNQKDEQLTLLPFLGMALMRALRDFPQCNASYDKQRNVLLLHDVINLGIATQTSDGLKVPVVHGAESLSLDALARSIKRVSDAARDNSIRKDELTGSTITITSLGKLGGVVSTPVINLPEVAIIGINRAVERPVVIAGEITIRLMMNLSSSFDHRFVDGYDAAAMIQRVRELLEHPTALFIDA